jgi:SAM-dependent methyltransferase
LELLREQHYRARTDEQQFEIKNSLRNNFITPYRARLTASRQVQAVDVRQHKADYGYDGDYRAIPAPAVAGIAGRCCSLRPSCYRMAARQASTSGADQTADITDLPFDDNSFDVIVSSVMVHNIPGADARAKAISEAARVLRPGGKLALVDIFYTNHYARQLRELSWTDTRRRNLGWRMWWGPGMAST